MGTGILMMGLLISDEQGSFSSLIRVTQFTRSTVHPPLLSHSQESLEVRVSQGSSYESRTGGLTSRRLCGPGGYHSWTRCDKRLLRPSTRVAVPQRRRQRAHRSRRRNNHLVAVGERVRRAVPLVLRTLRASHAPVRNTLAHAQDGYHRCHIRGAAGPRRAHHPADRDAAGLERTAARVERASEKPTRRSHRV